MLIEKGFFSGSYDFGTAMKSQPGYLSCRPGWERAKNGPSCLLENPDEGLELSVNEAVQEAGRWIGALVPGL